MERHLRTQHLRLSGGSIFHPSELPEDAGSSGDALMTLDSTQDIGLFESSLPVENAAQLAEAQYQQVLGQRVIRRSPASRLSHFPSRILAAQRKALAELREQLAEQSAECKLHRVAVWLLRVAAVESTAEGEPNALLDALAKPSGAADGCCALQ